MGTGEKIVIERVGDTFEMTLQAKKMKDGTRKEVRWARRRGLEEVKLMFVNVKKAHLYARCEEEELVQLPEEFWEYGKYSRLRRWLYGVRKAAAGWEEEYAGKLESEGFRSWCTATTSPTAGRRRTSRRSRRR